LGFGFVALLVVAALPRAASAQTTTKTFINYFEPTSITCPLTTNTWGCTATGSTPANCVSGQGVVPRDTCNGIESAKNPPGYYYWDGTVIRAADGTWHLFADRWPGTSGFGAWTSSDPIHAVGDGGALGPFTDNGYAYSNPSFGGDSHHGHNSSVVALGDGTFAMVVSEVVPFTIFTSSSLDGPWTPCSTNPGSGLNVPSSGFGGNNSYGSNVSLGIGPSGAFEIVQRHGLIATSTTGVCGPYKAQQPTNTYPDVIPAASAASIYPNRQRHSDPQGPSTVESTYVLAEDPVIWYSGGQWHVLYDYPDDRVGYHLTSTDGVHNWTDRGLAYDPRDAQQLFSYTDGTVDHWYKMERPNLVLENGHVTYVTFAVSDVDKNNQIGAGSDHGSKVIVIPFDGAQLDCDIGDSGCDLVGDGGAPPRPDAGKDAGVVDASVSEGGSSGAGSSSGGSSGGTTSGSSSGATSGGSSGGGTSSGSSGGGTSSGSTGSATSGGSSGGGTSSGSSGGGTSSGSTGGATSGGSSGGGTSSGSGGGATSNASSGGTTSGAIAGGGDAGATPDTGGSSSGCGCLVGVGVPGGADTGVLAAAMGALLGARIRRRRGRDR
jgi:hypothetical protein